MTTSHAVNVYALKPLYVNFAVNENIDPSLLPNELCHEAPPVVEEDFDLDVQDEQPHCYNCIFYDSILCEVCTRDLS